jgi:dCMP deaminase
MAITIGIKRIVCLGSYPETDYELLHEAGLEVIVLDKSKIDYWIKVLLEEPHANLTPNK